MYFPEIEERRPPSKSSSSAFQSAAFRFHLDDQFPLSRLLIGFFEHT